MIKIRYVLDDFGPRGPVSITERRGSVRIGLSRKIFRQEHADALTTAAFEVLRGNRWFQLWRGQIIASSVLTTSPHLPRLLEAAACPVLGNYSEPVHSVLHGPQLTSRYMIADLPPGVSVEVKEGPGSADLLLSDRIFPPEGARALDEAARRLLAGRQWFQVWDGAIVTA